MVIIASAKLVAPKRFADFVFIIGNFKYLKIYSRDQKFLDKFDALFAQNTGYEKLDKQLELTLLKKKELLLVLRFPFIPLHNNEVELGARVQARNRDIHLHTMSAEGTKIKDTLATIGETARKLGMNVFHYLLDRIIIFLQCYN